MQNSRAAIPMIHFKRVRPQRKIHKQINITKTNGSNSNSSAISLLKGIRQSKPPSGRGAVLMDCRHDGNRRGWRYSASTIRR